MIAYALIQKGTSYPSRLRHKKIFAGSPENPIAIDTYENLYKNLDDEFYRILAMYSWHKSGLYKVDIDKIPYSMVLGLKYLIDYNESQKMRLFNV